MMTHLCLLSAVDLGTSVHGEENVSVSVVIVCSGLTLRTPEVECC
jgi:hypothetical protein